MQLLIIFILIAIIQYILLNYLTIDICDFEYITQLLHVAGPLEKNHDPLGCVASPSSFSEPSNLLDSLHTSLTT